MLSKGLLWRAPSKHVRKGIDANALTQMHNVQASTRALPFDKLRAGSLSVTPFLVTHTCSFATGNRVVRTGEQYKRRHGEERSHLYVC
jgi:hypothetical protein